MQPVQKWESDTKKGIRALDRDLAKFVKSRGERRRLRAMDRERRRALKKGKRIDRAFARCRETIMREAMHPPETTKLRSWNEARKVTAPGSDLWVRSRVALKEFGNKRKRANNDARVEANAARTYKVLSGKIYRVTDDKDESKTRYVRPGLAKKIAAAGKGRFASDELSQSDRQKVLVNDLTNGTES